MSIEIPFLFFHQRCQLTGLSEYVDPSFLTLDPGHPIGLDGHVAAGPYRS